MTVPVAIGGFAVSEALALLEDVCRRIGVEPAGAAILRRGLTNAVFLLQSAEAVAKIARAGTPLADVQRTVQWSSGVAARTSPPSNCCQRSSPSWSAGTPSPSGSTFPSPATGAGRAARRTLPECFVGTVLFVDDIAGTGETFSAVSEALSGRLDAGAAILSAAPFRNRGCTQPPDRWAWTVDDWVVFPWERPHDGPTQPLPPLRQVSAR